MADPRIGIVTVSYRSAPHLPDFFASIARQVGVEIRLYFVDNDSPDESLSLARSAKLPTSVELVVIENGANLGVAAGNNAGIERALDDGLEWVVLLNNDTLLDANFLRDLWHVAQSRRLKILSPVIATDDPGQTVWYAGGHMVPWQGYRVVHEGMYRKPAEDVVLAESACVTGYAPTCCLMVHADVFRAVGLMDESYFVYSDDADFSVRCGRAGYETYLTAEARMIHKDGGSTGGNLTPFSAWWLTRNWVLLGRRHLAAWRIPLAMLFIYSWTFYRRLRGRDSWAITRLRLAAISAARKLDIHDHRVPSPEFPLVRE